MITKQGYLERKFKGEFRVIAEYDQSTNDFPKDEKGDIDRSFDDFYIPSRKKTITVRHAHAGILSCFIESITTGRNVLKKIYEQETGKELPKVSVQNKDKEFDPLVKDSVIINYEVLDGEVYFTFKADKLRDFASILALSTTGKKLSPFSAKNLPKSEYIIPEQDETQYKEALSTISSTPIMQANTIKKINKLFKEKVLKKKNKEWTPESRKLKMNLKQYIHYKGLWDKYIEFIREYKEEK